MADFIIWVIGSIKRTIGRDVKILFVFSVFNNVTSINIFSQ